MRGRLELLPNHQNSSLEFQYVFALVIVCSKRLIGISVSHKCDCLRYLIDFPDQFVFQQFPCVSSVVNDSNVNGFENLRPVIHQKTAENTQKIVEIMHWNRIHRTYSSTSVVASINFFKFLKESRKRIFRDLKIKMNRLNYVFSPLSRT